MLQENLSEKDTTLSDEFQEEYLNIFKQIIPHLDTLNQPDSLNKIFRGIHNIKGTVGFTSFVKVETLAHEIENLLEAIRKERMLVTPEVTSIVNKGILFLRSLVENYQDNVIHINDISQELEQALKNHGEESQTLLASESSDSLPTQIEFSKEEIISTIEKYFVNIVEDWEQTTSPETSKQAYEKLLIAFTNTNYLADEVQEQKLAEISDALRTFTGHFLTSKEALTNEEKNVVLDACHCVSLLLEIIKSDMPDEAINVKKYSYKLEQLFQEKEKRFRGKNTTEIFNNALGYNNFSLRINSQKLDFLIERFARLKTDYETYLAMISNTSSPIQAEAFKFGESIDECYEKILQFRLFPIKDLLYSYTRIIESVSSLLNKKIILEVEAPNDIYIKTSSLHSISSPIAHLLRNSCDHGIESPKQRISSGKSIQGLISLKAEENNGFLTIIIQDDGKGLDPQIIKNKAISERFISEKTADSLSEHEILKLIFEPGFSTAKNATKISGRGVGMDSVIHDVKRLNGNISIDSVPGKSFTVTLDLKINCNE